MKISISATNPCHLYDLARALHETGNLGRYYSGYPKWKLQPPANFPLVARSRRTLATYGLLRLPARLRPASHRLFRWQDAGFDRAVASALSGDSASSLHAMPGQALETFRAAREQGITTVLNHASGPVRQQLSLVEEEYRRAGVPLREHHGFDYAYFRREAAEYELADRHCAASRIVQRQLVAAGVAAEKIWIVPYAGDTARFHPPAPNQPRDRRRIVFAGQLSLRKGLRIVFAAMPALRAGADFSLHLYGPTSPDMQPTLAGVASAPWLHRHGAVSQEALADIFRASGMLVLPSWEEAFGLVVVQALNCGLPCIVSDRVGAADLIEHRRNGSVFPAGDSEALAREIAWWADHAAVFQFQAYGWSAPAQQLVDLSSSLVPS